MDNATNTGFYNKTIFYAVIAGLCGIIVILIFLLAQLSNLASTQPRLAAAGSATSTVAPSTPANSPLSIPTPTPATPESVAKAFYEWYFTYPSDPLVSGAYKNSGYLTVDFIKIVADFLQTYTGREPYDPIFCVKNKTRAITVGAAEYIDTTTGRLANVMIYRNHDSAPIYRFVLIFAGGWRINDIICVP